MTDNTTETDPLWVQALAEREREHQALADRELRRDRVMLNSHEQIKLITRVETLEPGFINDRVGQLIAWARAGQLSAHGRLALQAMAELARTQITEPSAGPPATEHQARRWLLGFDDRFTDDELDQARERAAELDQLEGDVDQHLAELVVVVRHRGRRKTARPIPPRFAEALAALERRGEVELGEDTIGSTRVPWVLCEVLALPGYKRGSP